MCRPKRIKVMKSFEVEGVKVDLFPAKREGRPAVYLNCYEGKEIHELLEGEDFNLIALSVRDWFCDLVPWSITSPFKDGRRFVGGAGEYLQLLTQKIIPCAGELMAPVSWLGIAGYSLGGLFAVWALYNSPMFSCAASMSGSFWFEGFAPYICANQLKSPLKKAYFSLGDKEPGGVRSPVHNVGEITGEIVGRFNASGIKTTFVWEKGGHNTDQTGRIARGISWLLKEEA